MNEFKYSQHKINDILINFIKQKTETNTNNSSNLFRMLNYSISGGKRLRPIIAMSVSNFIIVNKSKVNDISNPSIIKEENEMLNAIVLFVEFLHCASLILDDLPCMDNDSIRRGKPTFHVEYGVKNAFVVANFMISQVSGELMRQIVINKKLSSNIIHLMIKEMYDNNLLTSIGQIIDLENFNQVGTKFMIKMQAKISTNIFFREMLKSYCEKHKMKYESTLKNLLWLNMKTFPLFYLSFLLPYLAFSKQEVITMTLYKIEHIAICFSIMFQMSDDFEDYENDKNTNKIDSHVKIFKYQQLKDMYKTCKTHFLDFSKDIFSKKNKPPELFVHFVDLLNKKIELYDNGTDFE